MKVKIRATVALILTFFYLKITWMNESLHRFVSDYLQQGTQTPESYKDSNTCYQKLVIKGPLCEIVFKVPHTALKHPMKVIWFSYRWNSSFSYLGISTVSCTQ